MTKSIDDLPVNEAITLYYEKHHALRTSDLSKLRDIKTRCPDLFNAEKENQVRKMIEDIKTFENSDRYRELKRIELKKQFRIVKDE